ncbi:MAG: SDR family oxidoreductase [Acidimicrobiia bacterium]
MAGERRALVTGASAGIGRTFAEQLAARGTDLVLVARDGARLESLAADLRTRFGVEAEVLPADLLDATEIETVAARLGDSEKPVDLLVNNAGMGTFGHFADLDVQQELREIQLNVLALVRLTHAGLAAMEARGSGAVVNISSLAAYQPSPDSAVYSATKAFVNSFTHAVHEEAADKGVHVMAVCPGYTHTEFHDRAGLGTTQIPEMLWQSSDEVVRAALHDLDRRRSVSIPGAMNKTAAAFSSTAPAGVSRKVARMVIKRSG